MQTLATCARLVSRAISGTEAENFLYNSLLRLSTSSSVHRSQSSTRRAICSSPVVTRAVRLVTVSSGYSGHDDDDDDNEHATKHRENASTLHRTQRSNVYGDDAFFIAKNRLGDFLGKSIETNISMKRKNTSSTIMNNMLPFCRLVRLRCR
jgi:hypothetical protein